MNVFEHLDLRISDRAMYVMSAEVAIFLKLSINVA